VQVDRIDELSRQCVRVNIWDARYIYEQESYIWMKGHSYESGVMEVQEVWCIHEWGAQVCKVRGWQEAIFIQKWKQGQSLTSCMIWDILEVEWNWWRCIMWLRTGQNRSACVIWVLWDITQGLEWRHILEGAKHTIEVLNDHRNLRYFGHPRT